MFLATTTMPKEKEVIAEDKTSPEAEEEEEEEYVVEKILDMRIKGGRKEFFLKWKNYPEYVWVQ